MKLILPEQITEAQYKAYLEDWGTERIVPIASANPKGLSFEDWRAESIKRRVRLPQKPHRLPPQPPRLRQSPPPHLSRS